MLPLLLLVSNALACSCVPPTLEVTAAVPDGSDAPTNARILAFVPTANGLASEGTVALLLDDAAQEITFSVEQAVVGDVVVIEPGELQADSLYTVELTAPDLSGGEPITASFTFETGSEADETPPERPELVEVRTVTDDLDGSSCGPITDVELDVTGVEDGAPLRLTSDLGTLWVPPGLRAWTQGACSFGRAPEGEVSLVAVDAAGNESEATAPGEVVDSVAGCACSGVGSGAAPAWLLGGLALLGVARRRRR